MLKLFRINENTATIIVALERFSCTILDIIKNVLMNLEISSSRASLTRILESIKRQSSASPRKEGQFPIAYHSHLRIIHFELATRTSIVTTCAEAQVGTATIHIAADAAITLPVQRPTVPQIRAAREDEERACTEPRLLDDDVA